MPNRILKESICSSEEINQLTPVQEVFFYRLLVQCDDYGRFDARPAVVRSRCYPLRPTISASKVGGFLNRLVEVGLVWMYEVDGRPYLQVTKWSDHQQVRAKASKWPDPSIGKRLPALDINGYQPQAYVPENREYENREAYSDSRSENREVNAAPFGRPVENLVQLPKAATEGA